MANSPCPRCSSTKGRMKVDNGKTWFYRCFRCKAEWSEPKEDLETRLAKDGNLLILDNHENA